MNNIIKNSWKFFFKSTPQQYYGKRIKFIPLKNINLNNYYNYSTSNIAQNHLNNVQNFMTSFLPKDYYNYMNQYSKMSYHEMMDYIMRLQEKEKQGHMHSCDFNTAEISFLFCYILKQRQDYDNAINILYILNHEITEFYLNPQFSSTNNQTQHNLHLTNSLLEMSNLYSQIGDTSQQLQYLTHAEEQTIDFLGSNQERFEISLKFLQGYNDMNNPLKKQEYEQKILSLINRLDYNLQNYPLYKYLLKYFVQNYEKQGIFQISMKIIENYNNLENVKEELQSEIIPLVFQSLPQNSNEIKEFKQSINQLKLEIRDNISIRKKIEERISMISKLKYENKIDDALEQSHQAFEIIMNEQPNNIQSDLLLILFNNLFVLYTMKNDYINASDYGERWIKLSMKLKISSQIITSKSNVAAFYLKENQNQLALKHINEGREILLLQENMNCLEITDRFIFECLHFQINYINGKIIYEDISKGLENIIIILNEINNIKLSNNILQNKIIEMFTFLRNHSLKLATKPFALAYLNIKQTQKNGTISQIDYLMNWNLSEISFIENDYDQSMKYINNAIKIYEQIKQNNKKQESNNDNINNNGYKLRPRWILLQYIKACIEVKRDNVDIGFQLISQYPISLDSQIQQQQQSDQNINNLSIQSDKQQQKQINYLLQYWNTRLQAEIFVKLGQYNTAHNFILSSLKIAQSHIQDLDLLKNTHEMKLFIAEKISNNNNNTIENQNMNNFNSNLQDLNLNQNNAQIDLNNQKISIS